MNGTLLKSANSWMSLRVRKRPKTKAKAKARKKSTVEAFLPQPIANVLGAVPCHLCGHPVEASRMHPHLVRCHGMPFNAKQA